MLSTTMRPHLVASSESGIEFDTTTRTISDLQIRSTACPEKDELRDDGSAVAALRASRVDAPAPIRLAFQIGNALGELHREPVPALEVGEEVGGQGPVVHVRAGDHPGRRNLGIQPNVREETCI